MQVDYEYRCVSVKYITHSKVGGLGSTMYVKIKLFVCIDEYNGPELLGPLDAQKNKYFWSLGKS